MMNLEELQQSIKSANENTKPDNVAHLINEAWLQVSKGDIFHEMLSCQYIEVDKIKSYYLISYDRGCSKLMVDLDKAEGSYDKGRWQQVDKVVYFAVKEAIEARKEFKHLDNFTFITAYLYGKFGMDIQNLYVLQERE